MSNLDSLEFVLSDQWRQIHGLARIEAGNLVLEFRAQLLKLFRGSVQEVRIPLAEVAEVGYEYRLLFSLIRIRTRTLRALEGIPGLQGASLRLRIEGLDSRRIARAFVAELEYQRAIDKPAPFPQDALEEG